MANPMQPNNLGFFVQTSQECAGYDWLKVFASQNDKQRIRALRVRLPYLA